MNLDTHDLLENDLLESDLRENGVYPNSVVVFSPENSRLAGALGASVIAQAIALPGENQEFLSQLVVSLYQEFAPESPVEFQLVETVAVARWRQIRLWGFERATIANQIERSGLSGSSTMRMALAWENLSNESGWTEQMSRSEARIGQQYRQSIEALRAHRAWRRAQQRLQ